MQQAVWNDLGDPNTLGDMREAIKRIRSAVQKREHVGIIGDYDADGITGVAQLVRFFRRKGTEPHVILPHRARDGYGLKKAFMDEMLQYGVTLLITVDTGITAIEEIAYARAKGIDVIVTDHHAYRDELPDALILHPHLSEAEGPMQGTPFSGAGVAFTLLRALEDGEWEGKGIDIALAAIGTVADVVPLLHENRYIVSLGLAAMNAGGDHPVFSLADSVRKRGELVKSSHIGFRIAPRINAAGRIGEPLLALHALLEGGASAESLHTLNSERQEMTEEMYTLAESVIDLSEPVLMAASPDFHHGIIGLIAGRLKEKYGKPCVIGVLEGDRIIASARSIPKYHITHALHRCEEHLESCGGHAQAAGCTLESGRWRAFATALSLDALQILDPLDLVSTIKVDAVIDPDSLTLDLVRSLSALEPFGAGNPEPCFLLQNQPISSARSVGKDGQHLQCRIGSHKAVGWGLGGEFMAHLPKAADVVCRLGIDTWSGTEVVQLFIEDLAITTTSSVQRSRPPHRDHLVIGASRPKN